MSFPLVLWAVPPTVRRLPPNLPGLSGGLLVAGPYPEYPAATVLLARHEVSGLDCSTDICGLVSVDCIHKAEI